ncbi:aminoglycoside phosphotransferase [Streptomyces sp. NPDC059786]|uniref:aminoglycoside phosphotransferase n=1 Tax=Streptomyces sp. NPDC059786 TaxID=3346946 RepID=UPI003663AB6F
MPAPHRPTDLPDAAHAAIAPLTGSPIRKAEILSAGTDREIAARLHLEDDRTLFVKGMPSDHPGVKRHRLAAAVAPYTRGLGPALLWHVQRHGWDLLGFEDLDGRPADYRPGSPDVPLVMQAMQQLSGAAVPPTAGLRSMSSRLRDYAEDKRYANLFDGEQLVHTDLNPKNVLIRDGRAHLANWTRACRGAPWTEPSLWAVRLIAAGHTAHDAHAWAAGHPAWADAPEDCLIQFARAQHNPWRATTRTGYTSRWMRTMLTATAGWSAHLW